MWCSSVFKFVMFSEKWSISSWNRLDAMQYDFLKVWQIFSLERMNRFVSNFLHNDGKFLLHNRKIKWKSYFKSEFWVFFPLFDKSGSLWIVRNREQSATAIQLGAIFVNQNGGYYISNFCDCRRQLPICVSIIVRSRDEPGGAAKVEQLQLYSHDPRQSKAVCDCRRQLPIGVSI